MRPEGLAFQLTGERGDSFGIRDLQLEREGILPWMERFLLSLGKRKDAGGEAARRLAEVVWEIEKILQGFRELSWKEKLTLGPALAMLLGACAPAQAGGEVGQPPLPQPSPTIKVEEAPSNHPALRKKPPTPTSTSTPTPTPLPALMPEVGGEEEDVTSELKYVEGDVMVVTVADGIPVHEESLQLPTKTPTTEFPDSTPTELRLNIEGNPKFKEVDKGLYIPIDWALQELPQGMWGESLDPNTRAQLVRMRILKEVIPSIFPNLPGLSNLDNALLVWDIVFSDGDFVDGLRKSGVAETFEGLENWYWTTPNNIGIIVVADPSSDQPRIAVIVKAPEILKKYFSSKGDVEMRERFTATFIGEAIRALESARIREIATRDLKTNPSLKMLYLNLSSEGTEKEVNEFWAQLKKALGTEGVEILRRKGIAPLNRDGAFLAEKGSSVSGWQGNTWINFVSQ